MEEVKVSVIIPSYEYNGKGVYYLSHLFRTISQQTLREVEVVVPDHSLNSEIEEFCMDNIFDLKILYKRNQKGRGNASINKNVGMDLATGKIVKMMYMDDFFVLPTSLERTYDALMNSDKMWLVCGTNHTRDNGKTFDTTIYPKWNNYMLHGRGNNTMSGVSVLSYKNDNMNVRWDPNTCMLMDIDFYYQLRNKYGDCLYLNEVHVSQRVNDDALSSTISDESIQKEFEYCREKFGVVI